MKKIKSFLKKIWEKTDGWKTIGGFFLHSAWFATHRHYKMDIDTALWGHGGISSITGVGLGHKAKKLLNSEKGKKLLKLISKK